MKNFNLNQIQSNPDGQPTVKRQSRLMSHQGKAFQNVQMGRYCSQPDSVSSPSRCRVLGNMGGISALLSSRVCKYAAMLLTVLMVGTGQMWGETDYILGLFNVSDGNVALTKNSFGTNGALVYNGSSLSTTTAVSFKTSGGDAVTKGSIYYTTNTLTQANCTTATNAGTSSSDGYVRGFQIAVNSTYTLALGDVTATDIYIIGRFAKKQDASNVITIKNSSSETIGNISNSSSTGTNITPNHFSGTFTGNITIQNTSTSSNDEYRALIYIIASDGGGGGGGCTSITPTWSTDYSSTTLNVGATSSTPVVGKDGSSGAVTFSSSATDIATVNSSGVVTGVGAGTATITATVAANGDYCSGTVTKEFTIKAGITYNANGADGGSVPTDANTYAYNANITVAGNTGSLYKTGKVFNGWNTRSDGTGTHYEAGATMKMPSKSAGVTLYAEWVGYATSWEWWNCGQDNNSTTFTYITSKNYICSFASSASTAVASWDMSGGEYYRGIKIKTKDHSIAFWVQTGKRVSITFGTRQTKPTFTVGGVDKSSDVGASDNADSITVTYTTTGDTKFYIENETATKTAFTVKSVKIEDAAPSCSDPTTTFADGNCVIGTPLDLRKLIGSNDSSGEITYSVTNENGTGATIGGDGYSLSATTAGTCTVTATQEAASGKCEAVLEATITVSTPKRIYMKCGSTWCSDSPKFFVHSWLSSSTYTYPMTLADCETDVYYADIPSGHTGMLFTRQNSSTSWIIWSGDDFWGQSQDIEISTNDLFTCTGWSDSKGTFSGSTYSAPTRTIAYNANGGTGSMSSETDITCGDSQQLTANAFTRSGWTFTGWNTNKYGTGDAYADEATISDITENITLYAQWEKEIYMQATGDLNWWYNGSAWFAVYYWDSGATSNNGYVAMSSYDLCNTTYYKATIPGNGYDKLLFLRMNPEYNTPSTSTGKWNQTSDITYPSTYSLFTINGGGDQACTGSWGNPGSTYTITFNGNGNTGGSMSDVHNICSGSDETLAENGYTREGWTFTGWNTNKYGTGTTYADEATISNITADITLYAQWEKTIYLQSNVSWWYNDDAWFAIYCFDSSADTNNKWVKMTRAEECSSPAVYEVTMPGNGFDKVIFCRMKAADTETLAWSNKDNQTENIAYPTTNDKFTISNGENGQACTGSWGTYAIPTYTISYNKGTNGTGSRDSESKTCGVDFTLPSSAVFTRTGYTQTGWATSDGGDQAYALGGSYTTDAAVTFYPVWTADTYDVTLNTNDGTINAGDVDEYTYGVGATLPTNVTKTGYTFGGWYDNSGLTGDAVTEIGDDETGNKEYWAKWTAKTTTITINANTANHGSTSPGTVTATYGSALPSFTAASGVSGYDLAGYYTEATSGTKVIDAEGALVRNTDYATDESTPVWKYETGTLTLYAQYEKTPCPTSGSVYSLTFVNSSKVTMSDGDNLELTSSYATITGGVASIKYFKSGNTNKEVLTSGNLISYGTNDMYLKLELDCPLLVDDTIRFADGTGVELAIATDDGTPMSATHKETTSSYSYVVTSTDNLVGETVLYIGRSSASTTKHGVITIKRRTQVAPTFTSPAADQAQVEYTVGDAITALSVTVATSTFPAAEYQWYRNATKSTEGASSISGATEASYTPSNAETSDYYYYCVAFNSKGSATSHYFRVTVNPAPTYDATYDKNGHGTAPDNETEVTDVTLPQMDAVSGWKHTAWTADKAVKISGESVTAGTELEIGAKAYLTANTTFTAVWTETYAVEKGTYTNGSITISPTEDIEGGTISLTATPNDDYLFTAWTIKKKSDGTDVTSSVSLSGQTASATFTMPAYAVTIDATFTATDYCSTFTVSTSESGNLAADDVVVGTGAAEVKVISVGGESTLQMTSYGLSFTNSGDAIEVALPNVMVEGSIICIELYYGGANTGRGLTIKSTDNTKIVDLAYDFDAAGTKKLYYTVQTTDTKLIGSNKFRIARYSNVYLKSFSVGECGRDVYGVTYKANNSKAEADVSVIYEPTFADNPSFTVPSLKAFAGWNTKDDGTGTHYDVGDEVTEATTVYAEWRYKVVYIASSASESNDVTTALGTKYNVTVRTTTGTAGTEDYSGYALIVLSESLGGSMAGTANHEIKKVIGVDKPILNLKSYFYGADNDSTKRWQWAAPNAGRKTTSVYVKNDTYANLTSHPIYTGLTPDGNDSIQLVKSPVKTVKPIQPLKKFVSGAKGYTLAIVPDGTAIHELTAAQRSALTGETITSKYLLVSLTSGELSNLHDNTKTLLQNAADYLISGEQWVPQYTVTFKATNNSNWSDASNWEPACVPTISLNAVIEKPVEVDVTNAKAKSIVIDQSSGNTGSITIPAGKALVVAETVKKTTDGETLSATEVADLHIGSSSTGNGSLVMGSHDGTNKAQVDFYTKARKTAADNWVNQYIGTPFNVADGRGVKEDYYGSYLYSFNFSNQSWDNIKDEDYHFTPFLGYNIIRKDADAATLEMQGTLVATTNQSPTVYFKTDKAHSENVLANSWTAPIKIANFDATPSTGDFTNVEATIYIFNAGGDADAKAGGTAGNYTTYSVGSAGSAVIPSMQSFSVYATAASPSLTLNYARLVYNPAVAGIAVQPNYAPRRMKAAAVSEEMQPIRLRVAGESGYADELKIYLHEDFSDAFENGWDAHKMYGYPETPQLYAVTDDGELAILCAPDADATLLGFKAGEADTEYTFTFRYDSDEPLFLLDMQNNTYTEVQTGNAYTFQTSDVGAHNRFVLTRFAPQTPTDIEPTSDSSLKGREAATKLMIDNRIYILLRGVLYDATGKRVRVTNERVNE